MPLEAWKLAACAVANFAGGIFASGESATE